MTFNRTIVELKCASAKISVSLIKSFNRTIVELKFDMFKAMGIKK